MDQGRYLWCCHKHVCSRWPPPTPQWNTHTHTHTHTLEGARGTWWEMVSQWLVGSHRVCWAHCSLTVIPGMNSHAHTHSYTHTYTHTHTHTHTVQMQHRHQHRHTKITDTHTQRHSHTHKTQPSSQLQLKDSGEISGRRVKRPIRLSPLQFSMPSGGRGGERERER